MSTNEEKKCAHLPCQCLAANWRQVLRQACKDAGSEEVEIACQRDHTPIHLPGHRMKPSACWGVRWLVD